MNSQPIFIHSLFRSGSTYLFEVFRRSPAGYRCFQEAMHEIAFFARENPALLLEDHGTEKSRYLRHPDVGAGYFVELHECWAIWKESISAEAVYRGSFSADGVDNGLPFWRRLIEASSRRAVFQECRSFGRISQLRNEFGGIHLSLWRNPWDQWWSYKVDPYFDSAMRLMVGAAAPPKPVELMVAELGLPDLPEGDLLEQFDWLRWRAVSSTESYTMFFMLWCWALLNGLRNSDALLSIDLLSTSDSYRSEILLTLKALGVGDVCFDDCRIPRAQFGREDADFFEPIEERVYLWLVAGGVSSQDIERLKHFSVQGRDIETAGPGSAVDHAQRARSVARRHEDAVAVTARLVARVSDLKERIEALEQRLLQEVNRSDQAGVLVAETGLRLQREVIRAERAEERLAVTERRLHEEAARSERAEELAAETERRLQHASARAERAEERAVVSEQLLHKATVRAERAEERFAVSQQRMQQEVVRASNANLDKFLDKLSELETAAEERQLEIKRLMTELSTVQDELSESRAATDGYRMRFEATEKKLDDVLRANHHHFTQLQATASELAQVHDANHRHWLKAEQLARRIEELEQSWSWRLTGPIRTLAGVAHRILENIRARGNRSLASGIETFQVPLSRVMAGVLSRPQIRKRLSELLLRWPHLHEHLVSIAQRNGLIAVSVKPAASLSTIAEPVAATVIDPSSSASSEQVDLSRLTPRARKIFGDLQRATEKRQGKEV